MPTLGFAARALASLSLLWLLATGFGRYPPWVSSLTVLLLALPIAGVAIYHVTIERIHRLDRYARGGWIRRLFSGLGWRLPAWSLWALFSACIMLVQLQGFTPAEWGLVCAGIPLFYGIYHLISRQTERECKPYWRIHLGLRLARRVTLLLMVLLYTLLLGYRYSTTEAPAPSMAAQFAARENVTADLSGTPLVRELARWFALGDILRGQALADLQDGSPWVSHLLAAMGAFATFYNLALLASGLLIPAREYRRILGDLTDTPVPGPLSRSRLFSAVFWGTLAALATLWGIPTLDHYYRNHPEISLTRQLVKTQVIRLHDQYYRPEVLQELARIQRQAMEGMAVPEKELVQVIDRAFDRMQENLGGYLDWYYSLGGEYTRLGKMLVGELDALMRRQLQKALLDGDPFRDLPQAEERLLAAREALIRSYQDAERQILEKYRVAPGLPVQVVRGIELEGPVFQGPPKLLGMNGRLAGSGAAGAVGAYVTSKIVAKAMTKGVSKLALKTLTKFAAKKTLGVGAGALAGGVAGSSVPLLGTAVGAAIGGITAWVLSDYAFLKLEEVVNREEYERALQNAIEESRKAFKAKWISPAAAREQTGVAGGELSGREAADSGGARSAVKNRSEP